MYKIIHIVRHVIPDDRLCRVTADADAMTFAHRFGHIHPSLVWEMNAISLELVRLQIFDLDPARLGQECSIQAMLTLTDALPDGRVMSVHVIPPCAFAPPCFEVAVRRGCIDPALLREMNEEVLPAGCGALVPV